MIDPTTITASSPKKYVSVAMAGGFEVRASTSRTFEQGAVIKSGKRAGERWADKDITHLWVQGRARDLAKFSIHFENNRFTEAMVWDVAGWPMELFADFAIGKTLQKELGLTREDADALAAQRDAAYNDGSIFISKGWRYVERAGEFDEWLGEMCPEFRKGAA